MMYFPENPWITDSCTANHNSVNAIPVLVFNSLLWAVNITISKYGYMNAWIAFYLSYERPVCLTFVHLASGASMYSQSFNTNILQTFGYFFYVFCVIIPAKPCFYCYRQIGCSHNCIRKANHEANIFQDACTCTFAGDFFYRTSKINVKQIRVGNIYNFFRHGKTIFVATKYLYAYWFFIIEDVKFLPAFYCIANQAFTADKLCIHKISAIFFAYGPKRRIAYIFHWSKQKRK